MSQKRTMPTKAKIVEHWNAKYDEDFSANYCWGCGHKCNYLERAHLLAKCEGGTDEENNLILLCRICHVAIQEHVSNTIEEANHIKEMILEGMPFYKIHSVFYAEKIKSGIYDKTDLTRIGVSKEDLEQFKQIMK